MSFVMAEIGILLALLCALGTNLAFLCKQRGAAAAPEVRFRHPLRSAVALFRSRWWAIGFSIAAGAWALHVAALAIAPLSLIQAVIAGGLVLLAFPAKRWFGHRLGRREWWGLGLAAGGLAFLALTVPDTEAHSRYSTPALIAFEAAAIAVGACLLAPGAASRVGAGRGVVLGAAAGLLVGVSDVAIKALAAPVLADPVALLSPWTGVALAASIGAFFALARGLQLAQGISVIALSSVTANCAAILGGIVVFGDPVGADLASGLARGAAFAAVVGAAALIPAPLRSATG